MKEGKNRSGGSHVFTKFTLLNYVNLLIKSTRFPCKNICRLYYRTLNKIFCFSFLTFYVTYAATAVSTASYVYYCFPLICMDNN